MSVEKRIYTVELRIAGVGVMPDQISSELGLAPSQTRFAGESKGKGRTYTQGLWAYSAVNGELGRNEWSSLEKALSSILSTLADKKEAIAAYSRTYDVHWWCGQFQSSFEGGFTLSVDLLRELSNFGVELVLETYWADS